MARLILVFTFAVTAAAADDALANARLAFLIEYPIKPVAAVDQLIATVRQHKFDPNSNRISEKAPWKLLNGLA